MILGVALVAQELNKGPRLVYRYPPHRSDYLRDRIISLLSPSSELGTVRANNPKAHYIGHICNQYESLSDEPFAKLFKEKASFIGRASEFSIEDKSVTLPGDDPIATALSRRSHQVSGLCAAALKRVVEAMGQTLQEQERRSGSYVSTQVGLMLKSHEYTGHGGVSTSSPTAQAEYVLMVTFPNHEEEEEGSDLSPDSFSDSPPRLTLPLSSVHSSSHSNFPSSHSHNSSVHSDGSPVPRERSGHFPSGYNGLDERMFLVSSLANELRVLFHSLTGGRSFNLRINAGKMVSVSFQCREPVLCEETSSFAHLEASYLRAKPLIALTTTSSRRTASRSATNPPPPEVSQLANSSSGAASGSSNTHSGSNKGLNLSYVAVLLLADAPIILSTLNALNTAAAFSATTALHSAVRPRSNSSVGEASATAAAVAAREKNYLSNTRIKDFIEGVDPTKSIMDLSISLDEPVEELILMANYLQNLGLAELLPIVHKRSCYKVHPGAPFEPSSAAQSAFREMLTGYDISQPVLPSGHGYQQTAEPMSATYQITELGTILSFFDGQRDLDEIGNILRGNMRRLIVEIAIFLLRWHLLVPMGAFVVDLRAISETVEAGLSRITQERRLSTAVMSGAALTPTSQSNGTVANTPTTLQISGERQKSVAMLPPQLDTIRMASSLGSLSGLGSSSHHQQHHFHQYRGGGNGQDFGLIRRLKQEMEGQIISASTLAEIACACSCSEMDLSYHVGRFFPHFHIVRKPIAI